MTRWTINLSIERRLYLVCMLPSNFLLQFCMFGKEELSFVKAKGRGAPLDLLLLHYFSSPRAHHEIDEVFPSHTVLTFHTLNSRKWVLKRHHIA